MRKTGGRLPGSKRPITELNLFCEAVIMSSGPASLASSDETNECTSQGNIEVVSIIIQNELTLAKCNLSTPWKSLATVDRTRASSEEQRTHRQRFLAVLLEAESVVVGQIGTEENESRWAGLDSVLRFRH